MIVAVITAGHVLVQLLIVIFAKIMPLYKLIKLVNAMKVTIGMLILKSAASVMTLVRHVLTMLRNVLIAEAILL